jgi:hypothetical protein
VHDQHGKFPRSKGPLIDIDAVFSDVDGIDGRVTMDDDLLEGIVLVRKAWPDPQQVAWRLILKCDPGPRSGMREEKIGGRIALSMRDEVLSKSSR